MKRMHKKGVIIMGLLLTVLTALGLGGCKEEPVPAPAPDPEPIDGGTTVYTDENAPKTIVSKDIYALDVACFIAPRWHGEDGHDFHFRIFANEESDLIAKEESSGAIQYANEVLLSAVQAVIDKHELAAFNGVYEVTAGLSPEYQEKTFNAEYASGETLRFTLNNDPYAAWALDLYDVFAAWFASCGDESLYPAKEATLVSRFDLRVNERGVWTEFSGINVSEKDAIDGQTYLLHKSVYDEAAQTTRALEFRLFPEDYYAQITDILAAYDVTRKYELSAYDVHACNYGNHDEGYYGFGSGSTADAEEDAQDLYLELYAEFESGRRLSIETRKESEIQGFAPLLSALFTYCDQLF